MTGTGVDVILVLPADLASQIAAGEVVERPASAVKELVENALDAGATRCDVAIEGGGITSIRVADDGRGMSEADARLAVERHATSKLRAFSDLRQVATFGFRGEALPSIASVSRFTLRTRTMEEPAGIELQLEGGGAPALRPAGLAVGTEIWVRDLFFNVPARRKFLRSTGTESGHVVDTVEALALARPDVTFTVTRDGRQVREWLRAASRGDRVRDWLEDVPLIPCAGQRGPLGVEAWISRPEQARTGAGGLRLLVNGRVIRDRALAMTVAQAYGSALERGRYPRGAVYLDLPRELVDVNVHPQKTEVRFVDPRAVADALYHLLSRELSARLALPRPNRSSWALTPERTAANPGAAPLLGVAPPAPHQRIVDDEQGTAAAPPPPPPAGAAKIAGNPAQPPAETKRTPAPGTRLDTLAGSIALGRVTSAPDDDHDGSDPKAEPPDPWGLAGGERLPISAGTSPVPAAAREEAGLLACCEATSVVTATRTEVDWTKLRFLAQVQKTYLVCEGKEGLYVIDQHAAAERVSFHRLRRAYAERSVAAQSLLFPQVIEALSDEVSLVERHQSGIAALGLDLRVRGPRSLSIHAVPRLLQRASPERLVRDLIVELSRTGSSGFSDAVSATLARMACHGAIRAGDPLSSAEASALLIALGEVDFAAVCTHGRPVVAFTSWAELERKVGRR